MVPGSLTLFHFLGAIERMPRGVARMESRAERGAAQGHGREGRKRRRGSSDDGGRQRISSKNISSTIVSFQLKAYQF